MAAARAQVQYLHQHQEDTTESGMASMAAVAHPTPATTPLVRLAVGQQAQTVLTAQQTRVVAGAQEQQDLHQHRRLLLVVMVVPVS